MAISATLGFLLEPVIAVTHGYVATHRLRKGPGSVSPRTVTTTENFPEEALKKIRAFITDLGLDPISFKCILKPNLGCPCAAMLSLKWHGIATLVFDPAFAETIAATNPLTPEMKFLIAHEIGHHMHDDLGTGLYENWGKSSLMRLTAMSATAIVLGSLTTCGALATYLALCAASKATDTAFKKITGDRKEFDADFWASSQSTEIKNGGIIFFESELKKNLKLRNERLEKFDTLEKDLHSCLAKWIPKIGKLVVKSLISSKGESYLDHFQHPLLSSRIRALQQLKVSHTDSQAAHPPTQALSSPQ